MYVRLREMELICELMCEGTQGRERGRKRGRGREGEGRAEKAVTVHTLLCASTNLTPFHDIDRMISGNFFMFSVDVWNTQNTSVRACILLAY